MNLPEKIKEARKKAGLSQKELAQKLDMNLRTYGSYERGERDVSTAILLKICKTLNISSDYLLGRNENNHTETAVESNIGAVLPQDKIRMIPVYESVSAGFGAYADDYITEYIPLYIVNDEEAENTMCIVVTGDSMYPKIENGDKIQVLRQDWAENGQVVVALIDGENGVVKKIEYDDDIIRLISFNPEYQPREFSGADRERIRILGVVKTIIKTL
ncbi:XRE family transcriptional regulator [uncultured Ruminococcus sp.]|uniref:helix-turn-helix domain-containing protein n=1 Tax=uncultured Ruminococcus sp. TaxID=165186 RepID=UPI0025D53EF3|nr:XRE family transcriptional regulator [uncultured Ruminococcus sp.]